jgi:hypothetical protein
MRNSHEMSWKRDDRPEAVSRESMGYEIFAPN